MTPEDSTVTQAEPARPVPGWTHEELSTLFWHHHNSSLVASAACALLVILGAALLAAGSEHWFMLVPAQVIAAIVAVWHRASARILTKLSFPGRRVG